jgi:hypothetical protein
MSVPGRGMLPLVMRVLDATPMQFLITQPTSESNGTKGHSPLRSSHSLRNTMPVAPTPLPDVPSGSRDPCRRTRIGDSSILFSVALSHPRECATSTRGRRGAYLDTAALVAATPGTFLDFLLSGNTGVLRVSGS